LIRAAMPPLTLPFRCDTATVTLIFYATATGFTPVAWCSGGFYSRFGLSPVSAQAPSGLYQGYSWRLRPGLPARVSGLAALGFLKFYNVAPSRPFTSRIVSVVFSKTQKRNMKIL